MPVRGEIEKRDKSVWGEGESLLSACVRYVTK